MNLGKLCVCVCVNVFSVAESESCGLLCKVNSVSLNMIVTEITASLVLNAVHSHNDNNKQCVVWEHTNVWLGNSNEASEGL